MIHLIALMTLVANPLTDSIVDRAVAPVMAPTSTPDIGVANRQPWELAQVIEQRIIIRIPVRPFMGDRRRPDRGNPPAPLEWHEKKGPKCVPLRSVGAAALSPKNGLEFLLRDNSRLRVKLEHRCRTADLYSGFYVQPQPDGALCAGRDEVLTRSGMRCEIDAFRKLEPKRR